MNNCDPQQYKLNPGGRLRCLIEELKSNQLIDKNETLINILNLLTYPYSDIETKSDEVEFKYILSEDGKSATLNNKTFLLTKNINNDIITYKFDDKEGEKEREEKEKEREEKEKEREEKEEAIIKQRENEEGKTEEEIKSGEEERKRSREEKIEKKRKKFEKIETERKILYKISKDKLVSKTDYDKLKNRYELSTCYKDKNPKIWIIPDKQFQPLIDQMKIANGGSFTPDQENAIKQHKLERTNCL